MIKQKARQSKFIRIALLFVICMGILIGCSSIAFNASAADGKLVETVYTNNTPWPKDWKHEVYRTDKTQKYMAARLTEWVNKEANDITIQFSEETSGTISYTVSGEVEVSAATLDGAISASSSLTRSLGYSYTTTATRAFTWTVSPDEIGEYFCIGVNYQMREYEIKHYLQKFKWFGQGDYNYYSTTTVSVPSETYLAKNYRYEIDGDTYEK